MFIINNLTKQFNKNKPAVNNLSFEILDNEVLGIVGKSGVGKSTLMRLLSLQIKPDQGSILYNNLDITNLDNKNHLSYIHKTSFIYQNFVLLFNKTVLENITLPLKIRGVDKKTREELALEMLKFVGLLDKANEYPSTLSGGESQRVAIARSLVTKPEVLFCDEITSSLDSITSIEILNLLKKIKDEFMLTIIFVSHDITSVKYICDRVLLLEDGLIKKLESIKKIDNLDTTYESLLWGDLNV